ncbi:MULTISPECIES: hypothetical protein [unclassified Pseudomonas]|uniref:hypothetical protein n=1 Tax=unclassified Pseudomonas TaxID=196821 RepID=UPI001463E6A3|nr:MULTISPECIES: hypothetical protein [unclassified Pseudomonas]QJI19932.1 hypothetical protein HKK57_17120 [Pseudomonas sp. ADAK21]QJI24913.1 hypothetical protein HKK56_15970 [Pseudomonas sp. ADAK20]
MVKHRREDDTTPSPPVSTPPKSGPDWAMQAFIDLKIAMASMESSINNLSEKVGELKDEHSKVRSKLSTVEKQIYAATAVITVVIGIGGYLGNKAIDFGMDMAKRTVYSQPAPSAPQPQLIAPQQPSRNAK